MTDAEHSSTEAPADATQAARKAGFMHPADSLYAAALLTALPVSVDHAAAGARGAAAAWAYPLIGALVGLIGGLVYAALAGLGVAGAPAGFAAVAAMAVVTGMLHEDGLADMADGLGLAHGKARALEIMRDSRVGSFGVAALILALGARATAIGAFSAVEAILALAAAGALSRTALVWVWRLLPAAREEGLAAEAGRPEQATALAALAIGVALALPAVGLSGGALLGALAATVLVASLVARLALRRIGGQTGDVLGGVQQLTEAAALTALTIGAGVG